MSFRMKTTVEILIGILILVGIALWDDPQVSPETTPIGYSE